MATPRVRKGGSLRKATASKEITTQYSRLVARSRNAPNLGERVQVRMSTELIGNLFLLSPIEDA